MKKLYDKVTYQYNKKKQIYVVQFTIVYMSEMSRFPLSLFWQTIAFRLLECNVDVHLVRLKRIEGAAICWINHCLNDQAHLPL